MIFMGGAMVKFERKMQENLREKNGQDSARQKIKRQVGVTVYKK